MASIDQTLHQNTATAEEILEVADAIWEITKSYKYDLIKDSDKIDKLLESLQKEYSDFATSFPVVLKFMVQLHKYNRSVFNRYLISLGSKPTKDLDDFIDKQATYVANLERHYHPTHNEAEFRKHKKYIFDTLKAEYTKIEDEQRKKEERDKRLKEEIKKEEIEAIMKKLKEQTP